MIMSYKTIFAYQVLYDLRMYNYKNAKNRDFTYCLPLQNQV